ncbi:lipopolysaccharide-assembly, LptC-related protein [Methylobacterium sp.]|jgi:lipopolysaccharide export system protein LptC|uniref:lipopolysaccharide-assembly, LptC-related protein n=1 Tax=Methylobacterium sp. TaxID=409 RepID=UPI00262F0CCC|nr:lipopolysaccharide-assembly, LptC-related protein [Methylobacterium sp.]MDB5646925.1 lipopolysaccharide-assembly, LptC-related protein [Methylobacterium sp.]
MHVGAVVETGQMSDGRVDARRTRAHARARSHSAHVRTLRRVIPLAAGTAVAALLAITVFNPFGVSLPDVSMGPVSLSGTRVKMESPRLSGFRKGDRGYEVTATAAFQDVRKPSVIELQAMKGHLNTDDKGGLIHLEAAAGVFDSSRESMTLERDIRLWTDKDEEVRLKSAAVDFKAGSVKSNETVTVTVPSGTIVADTLDVVDSGHVISFVGNVHTVLHARDKSEAKSDSRTDSKSDAAPVAALGDKPARIRTTSAEPDDGERRR